MSAKIVLCRLFCKMIKIDVLTDSRRVAQVDAD